MMLRNKLTLSILAIIGMLSVNAHAEVIAYIPNRAGGTMYVTDARCEPAESNSLAIYTTTAGGMVQSSGCMQSVDEDGARWVITWMEGLLTGRTSIISAFAITLNPSAGFDGFDGLRAFATQNNVEQQPESAIETKEWLARNPWFNSPEFEEVSRKARAIDKQVHAAGYRLGDGKYFDELDRRLIQAGIVYTPRQ